jgi:S-DNA-T family DNA segregation ATPase FtsK/SpoIIIE
MELRARWPDSSSSAMSVRALPALVSTTELTNSGEPWSFAMGIGGDTNETISLRLVEHRKALVAGPPGSGKTTALLAIARAATQQGHRVVLLTGRSGATCTAPAGVVRARTSDELLRSVPEATSALILVDDVELVLDAAMDDVLVELMSQGRHRVVLAGNVDDLLNSYRGSVVRAKRSRIGLLLAARPADGELFALPRHSVGATENTPPGRGLLVQSGTITEAQVACQIVDNSLAVETQPGQL